MWEPLARLSAPPGCGNYALFFDEEQGTRVEGVRGSPSAHRAKRRTSAGGKAETRRGLGGVRRRATASGPMSGVAPPPTARPLGCPRPGRAVGT